MIPQFATRTLQRATLSVALAAFAFAGLAAPAHATDARVRAACTGDYLSYCSQHDPDGPGVRKCMRANGFRLSAGCVAALVAAGEVGKSETERRSTAAK